MDASELLDGFELHDQLAAHEQIDATFTDAESFVFYGERDLALEGMARRLSSTPGARRARDLCAGVSKFKTPWRTWRSQRLGGSSNAAVRLPLAIPRERPAAAALRLAAYRDRL